MIEKGAFLNEEMRYLWIISRRDKHFNVTLMRTELNILSFQGKYFLNSNLVGFAFSSISLKLKGILATI
jgi:hypothetical protein